MLVLICDFVTFSQTETWLVLVLIAPIYAGVARLSCLGLFVCVSARSLRQLRKQLDEIFRLGAPGQLQFTGSPAFLHFDCYLKI